MNGSWFTEYPKKQFFATPAVVKLNKWKSQRSAQESHLQSEPRPTLQEKKETEKWTPVFVSVAEQAVVEIASSMILHAENKPARIGTKT